MRTLSMVVASVVVVACGDPDPVSDPTLHELTSCEFSSELTCEMACANWELPDDPRETACDALVEHEGEIVERRCEGLSVFEVDGVRGCCHTFGESVVRFAVCQ